MGFKKNRVCKSASTGYSYRIESGPYRSGATLKYLVEAVDGSDKGSYALLDVKYLRAEPPKAGDVGVIMTPDASLKRNPYSPHTLVYMDDDVILTKDRMGDYDTYTGANRQRVLDNWEPQS